MYPEIPAGYLLARYHFFTPEGDNHAFILCGHHNTSGNTDADTVAHDLFVAYQGNMFFGISNQVSFADVNVTLNVGGTLTDGISDQAPVAGGDTSAPLSPQVSVLIRKITGVLGRHFRGRMYIPGVSIDKCDANLGFLNNTALGAFDAATDDWQTALGTAGYQLAILHRNVVVPPTLVTDLEVIPQVATQRRRNRKAPHH